MLKIQNLALIAHAEIRFERGLSILTGESGCGKSMVLDALSLLSGDARTRLSVRSGKRAGFVEAEFQLKRNAQGQLLDRDLAATLIDVGFEEVALDADQTLVLSRKLNECGRGRCFVQGQTVTRPVLQRIARHLLEVCGQSEAHNLRSPLAQLEALDRFAQVHTQRSKLATVVRQLRALEDECARVEAQALEAERRRDFLEYQLEEFAELSLEDLDETLERKKELSERLERDESYQEVCQTLSGKDGVLARLKWLRTTIERDPALRETFLDSLETAIDQLLSCEQEAQSELAEHDQHEFELRRIEQGVRELKHIAEKHRIIIPELPERQRQLQAELETLDSTEHLHEELQRQIDRKKKTAFELAETLHAARAAALPLLEERVSRELFQLGMESARLQATLEKSPLTSSGVSALDLRFSANPGHPARALHRVASGGELSRILLAFRLATESEDALLLFDEIDAGAGGKTADKIARSLKRASERTQVLAVTHWPQVAGLADCHFSVHKKVVEGAAETVVSTVLEEERITELSRMLGGASETAREHASGLLERSGDAVEPTHDKVPTHAGASSTKSGANKTNKKGGTPRRLRVAAA